MDTTDIYKLIVKTYKILNDYRIKLDNINGEIEALKEIVESIENDLDIIVESIT